MLAIPPLTNPPPPSAPVPPLPPRSVQPELPLCERNQVPSPCVMPNDAYRHDGFYLRFGVGGLGTMNVFGSGPNGNVHVHGTAAPSWVAIGGNVADGLVVAGALTSAQTSARFRGTGAGTGQQGTVASSMLGVLVDWYPVPTDGWHAGAIAGFGVTSISNTDVPDASALGLGGALLGGYDWWIGPQWSLGLHAIVSATSPGSLRERDGTASGYKLGSFSAGLGWSLLLH